MTTHVLRLLFLLLPHVICQTTDKYTDEDRPYKFGFNIQGYQHRQEEKDEKGLIKGEYGFITADGYYRVTVYATDENGDFRILSMKNYYVGFPPEDPTTTPEIPTQRPATSQPLKAAPERPATQDLRPQVRPTGVPGCSDCWIPTTTSQPDIFSSGFSSSGRQGTGSSGFGPKPNTPGSQNFLQPTTNQNPFQQRNPARKNQALAPQELPSKTGSLGSPKNFLSPGPSLHSNQPEGRPHALKTNTDGERRDFLNSAKQRPRIGEERDGLPPGVTVNDIKELLYRFNYTVGFHGHHEDGYRNGDKVGDYFFDGRDGTERQVKYLANEFGFQPNITFIELAENDERRPKEDTEKLYGLKGYEFKWFYRR